MQAQEYRIKGQKISELEAEYVQINGSSKVMSRGGFNMTIDVGEANSIWGSGEITKDGEVFTIKSPMFLVNLFTENGYELVYSNSFGTNYIFVQYILKKKKKNKETVSVN